MRELFCHLTANCRERQKRTESNRNEGVKSITAARQSDDEALVIGEP